MNRNVTFATPSPAGLGAACIGQTRGVLHRLPALLVDALLVLVFATIGRRSHDEGLTLAGIWRTAWPFLTGLLVGWAAGALAWRGGFSLTTRFGALLVVSTVFVGMLLRRVAGDGTALAFVLVTATVLGVFLLGWRYAARRARAARATLSGAGRP